MKSNTTIIIIFLLIINLAISKLIFSQTYPSYGNETKVTINGLNFDAMEPFLSPDGNTLFFNSLNSGGNTNLYYASKINDSTFNYAGNINGCLDTSANHLDAVASIDGLNNFYWISLRNYPIQIENLHKGIYSNGLVTDISRVYGNFNMYTFGWIIMDAAINQQGNELYFCNAYFDFINNSCGQGVPCKSQLGIAEKIDDTTFNKMANSETIFSTINDTNYLIYAPQISTDGLELYYTRLLKNTVNTELCVAVRNTNSENFSIPLVIYSHFGFVPEAITISTDKQKIYYHQKDASGLFRIFLRYRTNFTNSTNVELSQKIIINYLTNNKIQINLPEQNKPFKIEIVSISGQSLFITTNQTAIDLNNFSDSSYIIKIKQNKYFYSTVICKY